MRHPRPLFSVDTVWLRRSAPVRPQPTDERQASRLEEQHERHPPQRHTEEERRRGEHDQHHGDYCGSAYQPGCGCGFSSICHPFFSVEIVEDVLLARYNLPLGHVDLNLHIQLAHPGQRFTGPQIAPLIVGKFALPPVCFGKCHAFRDRRMIA